ncbi:MAG TPA: hypothetical protein VNM90_22355 [Haliangium sp.]|nr:hypothetical protein [Haliangium sp.]
MSMSVRTSAVVAVVERNRRIGERVGRILAAAIGLEHVACVDEPAALPALVGEETRLVACGEGDIEQVGEWFFKLYPQLRFLVWTTDEPARVMAVAAAQARLSNVLGWPRFASLPRPWELAMAARRLVFPDTPAPPVTALMHWGATQLVWAPRTGLERDRVVAEVGEVVQRAGGDAPTAERVSGVAHELLVNAMYEAPVDAYGRPRYAGDRTRDVALDEGERPTLRLVTDGVILAVEVADPFGGLERAHVFDRVARGLAAEAGAGDPDLAADEDLDGGADSGGHGASGAGAGMVRLYRDSAVLLVDVLRGQATRVISLHELNASARDVRRMAGSLHYFSA